MLEDWKQKMCNLVEVVVGVVVYYYKLVIVGKFFEEDVKKVVCDSLCDLCYGNDDYFFGFEILGVYVLNGGNFVVEGQ